MVLAPREPLEVWLGELEHWFGRTPGFFQGRPVLLDVNGLELTAARFASLIGELARLNIQLMGVEGAEADWLGPGMPPSVGGGVDTGMVAASGAVPASERAAPQPRQEPARSLIVDEPIRSGQSLSYPQGDVTVIGSVASGAEVIAGGSIHIYGTLRGRAVAGTTGNSGARIFCSRLQAELLAIDGLYRTAEDINPEFRNRGIHAWLDGDALKIVTIE